MEQVKKSPKSGTLQASYDHTAHELENYKLLVDSVQDYAIFLMDDKGYIQTWNKGAEKNKGYKANEIIGKHFSTFYRQIDLDSKKPERELEIAKKYGRAEDEDWRVRKDGSLFWASVIITTLYDKSGRHIGFAKVTRDLSERKKYEDELRNANRQLKQQQNELRQMNKVKDEFISLVSHQLRTPASAIKQLLGLYADGFITDIDEKHLNIIKKAYESNEHQIDIVNDLLRVAQIDSGKYKLSIKSCDLLEILHECLGELSGPIRSKNLTVKVVTNAEKHDIFADAVNIRMVFDNIIGNAIKYTFPQGTIRITIDENKHTLLTTVHDNGVGIAEQDLNKLFQKFSRIPNDLSDSEGGTGLGLYWSKHIVEQHGGKIEVSSELNEGSEFKVTLPKAR